LLALLHFADVAVLGRRKANAVVLLSVLDSGLAGPTTDLTTRFRLSSPDMPATWAGLSGSRAEKRGAHCVCVYKNGRTPWLNC
jgi:hypothetical protein